MRYLFLILFILGMANVHIWASGEYYLFVYFTGNTLAGQQIYYAISENGIDFSPLNKGKPVIAADTVALMKGVRDPHILRAHDGWFFMVATDMDWTKGKWSNRGFVMMRSHDLINWEHHTIDFHTRFIGKDAAKVDAVWAPQTIWDSTVQKYMIYFSLHSEKDGPYSQDAVYYTYATDDFSDVESDPKPLFKYPYPTIDTDIVQDESGKYHLFFNTWGGTDGVIRRQFIFTHLHDQTEWKLVEGRMQPNNIPSEGSCVYPSSKGGWMMVYDCFRNGFCQFCKSDDLIRFELLKSTPTTGIFTPRHGTVIQITRMEYVMLKEYFELNTNNGITTIQM